MAKAKIKNQPDNRKIAVYARKSKVTESGKSIEIQKEKCIALACAQFDANEADILIYEDEGKSGFYANRPQYKKMLHDIECNKIRAVICYKIDRISRRTVDLLNLVQQMEQRNISFISVSDKELNTSTRTGKIMISLLSAIAEFERDIIAERITDNMYELAKEGRWLGGECPLGYSSKREKMVVNGRKAAINHLVLVENEQQIVRKIFKTFLQTASLTATAIRLNNEGFRTKKGKDFTLIAVKNILQNPVYAIADLDMRSYFTSLDVPIWADEKDFDGIKGIMAYNKTEQTKEIDSDSRTLDPKYTQKLVRRDIQEWIIAVGKHKGIISGSDWIRVQNIITKISLLYTRPKEVSKALLSGIVRCSKCGGRMFVRLESGRYNPDGTPRFRYVCGDKYRRKGYCNSSPNQKGQELDNFIVKQISAISNPPFECSETFFIKTLLKKKNTFLFNLSSNSGSSLDSNSSFNSNSSSNSLNSNDIKKELNALESRLSQISLELQSQAVNLRTAPQNVKPVIYADIEALNREHSKIQNDIDIIHKNLQEPTAQDIDINKAKNTVLDSKWIHSLDYESKLQLLHSILECVIVKDDIVHIFFKGADIHDKVE